MSTDPRFNIINAFRKTIEDSFTDGRSHLKLINFGTGSGKTHQLFKALYESITAHPDTQIIGVYVAPLREHLQIPESVISEFPDVPAYLIQSLEMKTGDDKLGLYKTWIRALLQNREFWRIDPRHGDPEKIRTARQTLLTARDVIRRIEYLRHMGLGSEEFSQAQITQAVRDLNTAFEKFLDFVVKNRGDEAHWPIECLKLAEIYYPLHLLREKSGVVMLTCKKFETALPYFKFNGETWIKQSQPIYKNMAQREDKAVKFILALDEQEDGYEIMLNEMIDVISPEALAINNALSSINREFSTLFSSKAQENQKLLSFLEKNPGAFHEFEEYATKNKLIPTQLHELASIYHQLTTNEGNSSDFIKSLVKIYTSFGESLNQITQVFNEYDEEAPVSFNFDLLHKVLSKFENNRSLLIPFDLFQRMGEDLINIFTYNNLYIYNIEPLKELFLIRADSGHVHITEKNDSAASVADLIYAILTIRLRINSVKAFLTNVIDADDSQSHAIEIWSRQVSRVQRASAGDIALAPKSNYLNRAYVYDAYKTIINIMEISRYQNPVNNLVDHGLREVSIGTTAILTSPEKTIRSVLEKPGNIVFLISATGGIAGDLATSYDLSYLEDSLRDQSGQSTFNRMTEADIQLCEQIRTHRQQTRQISVAFFDNNRDSCPNQTTKEIAERFENTLLKEFINTFTSEGGWFGLYKVQELKNFIRFAFYLFEDNSIREMFALTQTIRWIRSLLDYCKQTKHANFIVEQSPDHPFIYFLQLRHPKYQSNLRVKILLYTAAFNHHYRKNSSRTYLDELHEQDGEKLFFVSAYASASKGLNPVVTTSANLQKDFDSLVLLMDSYFTAMKPEARSRPKSNHREHPKTKYHFALMKGVVNRGESLEIKRFSEYLKKPEAKEFADRQHTILLGKGILQSLGRVERRNFEGQVTKIYLNKESQKNLVGFYRYLEKIEPAEIRKLSVNNHAVYLNVLAEEKRQAILDYDDHLERELNASWSFHRFRQRMLAEIQQHHMNASTFDVTRAWAALRNPVVFTDPGSYLDRLRRTNLFPDDFIDALFYLKSVQQEFTPYVAIEESDGKKFTVISDSMNGDKIYTYQSRLYPDFLKTNAGQFDLQTEGRLVSPSTPLIYKLYRKLIPRPEVFDSFVPRPHFLYDVLYPSLAENFVERWIRNVIFSEQSWKTIGTLYGFQQLDNFKKYNTLYEKFDLYYVRNRTELLCIDVKAWSEISGNRLSTETLRKATVKLETIRATHPEFTSVNGLLLSLHSTQETSHQYSADLFSGSLIVSDEQNFPVESRILRNFLF